MHSSRLLCVAATIFLVCVGLNAAAQEKQTLKIGAVFSVTGGASLLGDPEKKTVQMVVDKINNAGGIDGRPLEIIIEDDGSDATKAAALAQKLINHDRVLALVGPSTSGSSMAVKPVCQQARVPMISCAAAEAIVLPIEESGFIFKTPQKDSHVVTKIIDEIAKRGFTKIAILSESLPFGQLGRKLLQEEARTKGIEVVADESYSPSETDFSPMLEKVAAAKPQAVVNWSILPAQSIIPKHMKRLGMTMPLFQSHGFGNPKYIEAAGNAAEGIIFPSGRLLIVASLPRDHPQLRTLWNYKYEYENAYGTHPSTFGGYGYDAIRLVIGALRSKQISPEMDVTKARELLRNGIEETKDWPGITGRFNMTPTDHNGLDKDEAIEMIYVDKGGNLIPLPQKAP